jgi:hypothetical protein
LRCANLHYDTALLVFGKTREAALAGLEKATKELFHYFASNQLVANASKTSFFVVRTPREKVDTNYMLQVGQSTIIESESINLLGVTITRNLSWDTHVRNVVSSLRSNNGLISRITTYVPNKMVTPLVHGLIMSKIRYCLPLFCDVRQSPSDPISSSMHDLQVQLNNAMRTVSGVKLEDRVEVSDLLLQVGIPSVNQLAAETTLLETWRQINLGFPTGDCFVFRNEHTSDRRTRNAEKNLLVTPSPGGAGMANFLTQGSSLWNMAPAAFRHETDLNKAKQIAKTFCSSLPSF